MTGPVDAAEQLARGVAREFRRRMLEEYVPRIGQCVANLEGQHVWQRDNEASNSIGNLLLHLEGNVRQWILCGIGGNPDHRDRDSEFAATDDSRAPAELVARLAETVGSACALVDGLGPDDLLAERVYQDRYRESGLAAVLHVMEHFAGHAGQIYALTKRLTGEDLKFYDL